MDVNDGDPAGTANLEKIDHVVVMMLENRSFDHMLGYLSLTGRRPEIDGLRPGLANEYQGRSYPVHHLAATALEMDPDHSASAIDVQIADGQHERIRGQRGRDPGRARGGGRRPGLRHGLLRRPPTCPSTTTWPNSSRSATAGSARCPAPRCPTGCTPCAGWPPEAGMTGPPYMPPLYHQPSFVRHLDAQNVSWRWYSFDPGTLRLADVHYRLGHHERFGYFSKTGLPWKTVFDVTCNPKIPSFLEDAAAGTLRQVSWIDPAFTNFNPLGFPVNDDHPMADIKDGQDLVLAAYDALASSPQWDRSPAGHRLRRKRRLLRSRPAARRPLTTSPRCSAATACACPRSSSRRGSSRAPCRTPCSTTPRSSRRSCCGSAPGPCDPRQRPGKTAQAGPGPAIPGHARGPGQPPRGTADPHHATTRPAAGRPGAAGRGPGRGRTGPPDRTDQAPPLNDLQKSILAATEKLRQDGHPPDAP